MSQLTKEKGFSLIEVLVALVILSISLLALAGLMVQTTTSNSFGGHMTEAATFAQDKLEELKALRPKAPPKGDIPEGTSTDNRTGATGIVYTRNWNVITNADGTMRTVNITINWTDRTAHSINMLSAITQ